MTTQRREGYNLTAPNTTPNLLEIVIGFQPWMENALCRQTNPEAFFPEKGGSTREAKKVCLSGDVREQCLKYALDNDERFGIWGGFSERERRRVKKRLRRNPQPDRPAA